MITGERFLACRHVVETVGLSKSEIYRQIEAGHFPRSRAYPNNPHRRFWLHSEVEGWMRKALAEADDLLTAKIAIRADLVPFLWPKSPDRGKIQ